MQFFQTDFYRNSLKVHEDIKKQNILPTTFPNLEFVMNGDKFYKKLWKKVDEADVYLFYHSDSNISQSRLMFGF